MVKYENIRKKILAIISFISICYSISGQAQTTDFMVLESRLYSLYESISRFEPDSINAKNNTLLLQLFDSVLRLPYSHEYPFSNLRLGNVASHDNTVRLFTWNVVHTEGNYYNYGLLQVYDKKQKSYSIYSLSDSSKTIQNAEQAVCTPQFWYGSAYYQLIEKKHKGETYYTLLGWNPNTIYTQKKVIETLYFNDNNEPVFGVPIIRTERNELHHRIVFEYSAKNSMMLRYDEQKKMLVYDHLSPSDDRYEGIFEFYGPDFSVDAYMFSHGEWLYTKDVDMRNPKKK